MGFEERRRMYATILLSLALLFLEACGEKQMERALDLYQKDRHEEALEIYSQALTAERDSALLNYNAGVALYRLKNYGEAIERFNLSLTSEDREIEAKADYNIGCCRFRQAELEAEKDPAKAVELYRDALAFFGRAMELNPGDPDAGYNHDLTGKKIKELEPRLEEAGKMRKGGKTPGPESKPPSAFPPPGRLETLPAKEDLKGGRPVKDEKEIPRKPEAGEMTVLSREEALKLLSEYAREEEALKALKKPAGRRASPNMKDW